MAGLRRRAVLGAGLATGVGSALAGCTTAEAPPAAAARQPAAFDPESWDSVRAQFSLDPGIAHFAAFVLAAHPAPVRAAIETHRAGLDTDTHAYLNQGVQREEEVREAAAGYLGANPAEIALTDSTTMGMGLLCGGMRLRAGQEVLTTEHDFFGTHEALRLLAERTGAPVRRVRLYDDPAAATEADMVARLRAGIGPATRLVVVTWVHSSTGVRLPIKAMSTALAEANANRDPADQALLVVDGVHGFAAVDTTVTELGCDFLTAGTHKWLFGPRGTGLLWGRAWAAVAPVIPSFSGAESPGREATPGGYHSFEHRWAAKEAFEFHKAIGRDRIAARIQEQATRLKEGLAGISSVRLVTPKDPAVSAGLVMCSINGMSPNQAVQRLRSEHRIDASVTPYAEPLVRFGPSIVTTPEQVDAVVRAVAALR
ncbi:MAG TPA: aminotransferase class V-fold PLP-dependent enzyme [Actinophytocola sp.]|uniref:aminotransferase class V-fold PLP-dependent enzyme n=1 Tax=Actinophytocola sp. TaxID=1872138 RepID=UPI002DB6F11A|nr:aminotransferase class V-fold PLP-dependent enzyme [Actinophytocola sp.]HEU5474686.1 aminotransferase class V-fold PLP-dependent enzyme [Actinophytocola sp.]